VATVSHQLALPAPLFRIALGRVLRTARRQLKSARTIRILLGVMAPGSARTSARARSGIAGHAAVAPLGPFCHVVEWIEQEW
jgi:hypothetical protein